MSAFYSFYPPSSAGSGNASVGTNGTTAPTSSTEIGGVNAGNLVPVAVTSGGAIITSPDPTGVQHVIVDSSALPTGASTSALQTSGNTSLSSIDSKTPALGQALAAASVPVVLTAAQLSALMPFSTVTANIGTTGGLALDTTVSALQVSQGSTTSGQKGDLVLGAVTTAAPSYTTAQSSPLSLTLSGALRVDASGSTQPVSGTVAISQVTPGTTNGVQVVAALPAGANIIGALSANQSVNMAQVGGSAVSLGQKTMANSIPISIASDQTAVPASQSGTWNINNISGTISLPTGASTSALQSTISGQLPATLGAKTIANSLAVNIASDQTVPINQSQIAGNSISAGQGVVGTGVQRVVEVVTSTSAITSVASSASSVSILASNANRSVAAFFNESTAICYLKLGATASLTSYTVQIPAGGYYELPTTRVYTGAIDAIWSAANGNLRITELS